MNPSLKNLLLFVAVLVLSFFTASYFGKLYDHFIPQYDYTFLSLTKSEAVFVAGIPFAYMFFLPFIFQLFASGNKNKIILWLLSPVILFYLYDSIMLSYLPLGMGLIGFGLARIINVIYH